MSRTANTKYNRIDKSITGDATIDIALWRLSLVLKEIAESTSSNDDLTVDDDPKNALNRSNSKKQGEKEVKRDDGIK